MDPRVLFAAAAIVFAGVPVAASDAPILLESSAGAPIDALGAGSDVRVFVFVRRDCPIANRYAPDLRRLAEAQARPSAGASPVRIWLVYVDPADTSAAVADHQREYSLELPWLLDPAHALASRAGATVTPEAAVYAPSKNGGRILLYTGRIDDRVADFGRARPAATTHELRDAIDAAAHGRAPRPAGGPAIGCFIADAR
jgi:hypothetical protein